MGDKNMDEGLGKKSQWDKNLIYGLWVKMFGRRNVYWGSLWVKSVCVKSLWVKN